MSDKKSALLLVDLQTAWTGANPLTTQAIERTINHARKRSAPVVWTFIGLLPANTPATTFGKLKETPDFQVALKKARRSSMAPGLTPDDNDWVIFKEGRNLFENPQATRLFKGILRVSDINTAGFKTSDCILSTCVGGIRRGFNMFVKGDLTADHTDGWKTSLPVLFGGTKTRIGEFCWN
jgi:nicotinamidase-related amidase